MTVVSVVIPAYNEERFIGELIRQIRAVDLSSLPCTLELVVVDDGSKDGTADVVAAIPDVRLIRKPNGGKGSAVRAGIAAATGEYVLIQDADLEYDPRDYVPLIGALLRGDAPVVYGSRYIKHYRPYPEQSVAAFLGGTSLSVVGWAFTGRFLTDTVTALKLFKRSLLNELDLQTSGFELDHEITAKVLRRGLRIVEIPIRYYPRSRADGKKIGLSDWFTAIRTFSKWGKR